MTVLPHRAALWALVPATSLAMSLAMSLAFAAAPPKPTAAKPPIVLAQFFENWDDEMDEMHPNQVAPRPNDGVIEEFSLDNPAPEGPLEGLPDGFENESAGAGDDPAGDGAQLGRLSPDFDPVERSELLGELYEKLKTTKTAEDAGPIQRAIETLWTVSDSDTVNVLMARAVLFANTKEQDLSLKILDAIVDIAPDETGPWVLRAKVHVVMGKPERALPDLRRALILDANHYRAIADLGLLLEQLGAKKEALEAYRRALQVNPHLEDAQIGVEALAREVEGQDI